MFYRLLDRFIGALARIIPMPKSDIDLIAMQELDPNRITIADVQCMFKCSEKHAERICELAVRQKQFEKVFYYRLKGNTKQ